MTAQNMDGMNLDLVPELVNLPFVINLVLFLLFSKYAAMRIKTTVKSFFTQNFVSQQLFSSAFNLYIEKDFINNIPTRRQPTKA